MRVADCGSRMVVTIRCDASIVEAAKTMRQYHVGALVVIEEELLSRPIGVVTDRDLVVEVLAEGVAAEELTVQDVMSTNIVFALENDGLLDTLNRMCNEGVRRIPIVDMAGSLKGILSVDDVLGWISQVVGYIPQLVQSQRSYEVAQRP